MSASCAISGSGKRGAAFRHDPPGETTLDPWLDDPFPDYDTEPVVAFQDYRCPSQVDLLIAKTTPDVGRRSTALSKCCRPNPYAPLDDN